MGGKVQQSDNQIDSVYELAQYGLVGRFIPRDSTLPSFDLEPITNATLYRMKNAEIWHLISTVLPDLPDQRKYPPTTWEWTIGRDFKDAVMSTGSYYLEIAIKVAQIDIMPLVDALYWLESSLLLERASPDPKKPLSYSLLKNTGLAHVHLIQAKLIDSAAALPLPVRDLFQTLKFMNWPTSNFKMWSSDRFKLLWGEFLNHPDATQDKQYNMIKDLYNQVTAAKK